MKTEPMPIMPPSPEAVIRGLYATLQGAEPTPLAHWVAKDVVLDVPGNSPNAGRYVGLDAFSAFVTRATERTHGTLRLTLEDVAVGRDHVIAVATYTAERPFRKPLENHLCHLLRVKDGKVVYSRFFTGDQYTVDAFWQD